ncbi:MAG: DUF5020 family protein [Bacteroidales bacterium]|nr:DUF5020 family protein [Bacteroidales bacterium]
MKKLFGFFLFLALTSGFTARAETNLQLFYDFGEDRKQLTSTVEGFYTDKWGNTFFFIDLDYHLRKQEFVPFPLGTYFEIARCLNFWQESALAPLSLHVEYNGGVYSKYGINHAALAGLDWFIHSKDFKNTLNVKVLYKYINYDGVDTPDGSYAKSKVPMQFTLVWGLQDLFGATGLRFSGFADFWWQEHEVFPWNADTGYDWTNGEISHVVFLSEPQLWYNVGRHFGVDNLNVGGELELSWDFGSSKGFWCRPCLGLKWVL